MKYSIATAVALLCCASATMGAAVPPRHTKDMMQRKIGRSFGPELAHRHYVSPYEDTFSVRGFGSYEPVDIAKAFAKTLTSSDFVVKNAYRSDLSGVTHVYLRQKVDGLEVMNGDININVDKYGNIISYGDSFARGKYHTQRSDRSLLWRVQSGLDVISSTVSQLIFNSPMRERQQQQTSFSASSNGYSFASGQGSPMDPAEAVLSLLAFVKHKLPNPRAVDQLSPSSLTPVTSFQVGEPVIEFLDVPYALSPVQAKPAYIQLENGDLQLVWDVQLELQDNWYNGFVHAHDGTIVSLVDWVSDAAYYNVIPFGSNDPTDTDQQLVKDPHDLWASPEGWHAQGTLSSGHAQVFNVTIGNNVYAHTNPDGGYNWEENYRPAGRAGKQADDIVFDYEANFERQEPKEYEDAAVTNLFYWCNMAHDLLYRYGFDEKAGNFQQDNLGRGRPDDNGANDAVIANAQDGSGRNNANFATPPDGRHGKMRMYVWDQTSPMRDGDFESGIIIHEYSHGLSIRLTGGPHNSNCLGWGEAGGMGEGWGDFIATIIRMKSSYTRDIDFGMGGWANGDEGIRKYKYSTSNITNPSTYKIMDRFDYWGVHAKGEVWAEMLYEVYWNLVDKHGFTSEWFPPVPRSEDDYDNVRKHILSHGNTLALQLVIDGMKLQPCNPSFVDARDAILAADEALTQGDNFCDIYQAFAKRGLGYGAKLGKDRWIEKRVESFDSHPKCQS
ncbi:Fungalysin metallopeptidase-domain-containing protein [Radiomyces spectabilis]|uniref:Fungalysin metallopeptidase-domain-containing protein n=1 Tax=Radiomyces spectabilis TaxID=64574 RepID=UPI00221E3CAB|nr:Fungalysin metallopeptidase-domain-containing protein [Radiomyces spectabilis]KAI8388314.1 Fungalysin metallopeptidase-domain-containing protein [Radiomyces spectabilis]